MRKIYMTPDMEIYNFQIEGALLAGSVLNPTDWSGGGGADSRLLEDNFLMDDSDLEKLLFP